MMLSDQLTADIIDSQPNFKDLPAWALTEYRALVGGIPPPTDDQIHSFATFVASAKSWYKHLPLLPPGHPFYFFIDPCAGLDRVLQSGGKATFSQRTENTLRFHYTWMTTEHYRAKFGRLSFSCEAGSQLLLPLSIELEDEDHTVVNGLLDNNPWPPVVYLQERPFRVPEEVLEAGRVHVTGIVHPLAARPWVVRERLTAEVKGGAVSEIRSELEALLRPERERIQMEMIAAMKRLRHLVYSAV